MHQIHAMQEKQSDYEFPFAPAGETPDGCSLPTFYPPSSAFCLLQAVFD